MDIRNGTVAERWYKNFFGGLAHGEIALEAALSMGK
jgi:hypothetical protein